MDVSDLRKRILRALDDARQDAVLRRREIDEAAGAYQTFLDEIAVPLMRQAAQVLNASGSAYAVHTPAAAVRLASNQAAQTFVELTLDTTGGRGQVIGRVSITRGRQGLIVEERPVAPGKSIAELTDEDVSAFLVAEIPKLVLRPA